MKSLALSLILVFSSTVYASWKPLLVQNNGFLYYHEEKCKGLPANIAINDIQVHGKIIYLTTSQHGIFKNNGGDSYWENITPASAYTRTIHSPCNQYRSISAFCVDGCDPARLYCATKYTLYTSGDAGKRWEVIPMTGLPANACITALYAKGGQLVVGTSWNGVYRHTAGRFVAVNGGLPRKMYSDSIGFYETIAHVSGGSPVRAATRFTPQVYSYGASGWKMVFAGNGGHYYGCSLYEDGWAIVDGDRLVVNNNGTFVYQELSPKNFCCAVLTDGTHYIFVKAAKTRNDSIRGLYAATPTSWQAIKKCVGYAKRSGCNALVFDIKDDYGNVYGINNETAGVIGALQSSLPLHELCNYCHANGIQVIGRMVVFKDKHLFNGFKHTYAIVDAATKKAWQGNPKEYWVDPYSEFVHRYTIAIAQQAQDAGFDEIQFDYVRFPTDGPVNRCVFTFKPDNGIYKYEAITDFLRTAKASLAVPVSADVYGFTVWYEFGQWLGQDIEAMTGIVDVLCPMVYPSHYGRKFFNGKITSEGYYTIVRESISRAYINSKATVRPYLQAFNMLSPGWGYDYIQKQIQACTDTGTQGYIFWNAGRDYEIIINKNK